MKAADNPVNNLSSTAPGSPMLELRDIHLPAEPGWWPPAPGWWLIALAVLLTIGLLLRPVLARYRLTRRRRHVIRQLNNVRLEEASANLQQPLSEMSHLARQYAVTCYGRPRVAALQGQAWLDFLDQSSRSNEFSAGPGRLLADAPYQRPGSGLGVEQLEALRQSLIKWIKKNPPKGGAQ